MFVYYVLTALDDISYFLFPFHELSANPQVQNWTIGNASIVAQASERALCGSNVTSVRSLLSSAFDGSVITFLKLNFRVFEDIEYRECWNLFENLCKRHLRALAFV